MSDVGESSAVQTSSVDILAGSNVQNIEQETTGTSETDKCSASSNSEVSVTDIDKLNESLVSMEETPIKKKKLSQKKYLQRKYQKIKQTLKEKIFRIEKKEVETAPDEKSSSDLINKLAECFRNTIDRKLKIQILTIFEDWPYSKIREHFDACNHMISVAKNLAAERGILSTPESRSGKTLDTSIVKKVFDHYTNDM
ncbi:hypothetical protein ANN_21524 [Periplaneta americana]|uniref:Uncharacterized protein n=1 Tax=Periplaneta americana TaxID=6978 RepID=A0ABQ8SHE7_PERAM|nr:hypothetical protein ANN_21524 [Periplaneta americana]